MIWYSIAIGLVLLLNSLVNASLFFLLMQKKLAFWDAFKLCCAATVLNKLVFSVSGYAAIALRLHKQGFPFSRALFAFSLLEFCIVIPWLALGLWCGAAIALRSPFLLVMFVLLCLFAVYKRKQAAGFIADLSRYWREIRSDIILFIMLACAHTATLVVYYALLSRAFAFDLALKELIKLVSISFTVGYFSWIPSGLAVREGALTFLLAKHGIPLKQSIYFALTDRVVLTGFYVVLGLLVASDMIAAALKRRTQG